MHIPDLEDFEQVCSEQNKGSLYYDLWHWPVKYLRGCVTSDDEDEQCKKEETKYFARLFVFKPAIDLTTLDGFLMGCDPAVLASPDESLSRGCGNSLEALRRLPGYADFPAELFGFLVRNLRGGKHGSGSFPQNGTVAMTLDSSPTLFGAYRELARWQLRGAADEINHPTHGRSQLVLVVRSKR